MRFLRFLGLLVASAALITGCTSNGGGPDDAGSRDDQVLGHVHGLGTDPADGALYIATHFGVFRTARDGSLHRVADRWQDTMAFTVVGPGHFLASGHPDLREDLPTHLGLIGSENAAESWSTLSLGGKADFHALDLTGDRIYGYDALTGRLLTTTDRTHWALVSRVPVVDLAADPTDQDRVLVSAVNSALTVYDRGRGGSAVLENAPPVVLLDWPTDDLLVGVTAGGQVYRGSDSGRTWTRTTDVPGAPEALDVTEQAWHIATARGIYRSEDSGRTWQTVIAAEN